VLELFKGNGTLEVEFSGPGPTQRLHVRSAAQLRPDVMAVGADIQALTSLDRKLHYRQLDTVDSIAEDVDKAGIALHLFALTS